MIFLDYFDRCKKKTLKPRLLPLKARAGALFFTTLFFAQTVSAFTPFVVRDIRVEGVQRTEAGTVFSYLPIKVGDEVSEEKVSEAVKALYATGFFRDVQIDAQGDVLLIVVDERSTISALTFSGNNAFNTEVLRNAMRDVGLTEGRIFDRAVLERATQELKRQYVSRGYYNTEIEMTMTPQERNRMAINFAIDEGGPSKIARIHVVGAESFSEKKLIGLMRLRTPGWFTWYTKNDQYSKQKLQADLESLRSFYQDQGYLEFAIESTQVSISPDKTAIDITVTISEGQRYRVSGVSIAGDLPVDESELSRLIRVRSGSVYSRARIQTSSKDIAERLGAEGYAFANVNVMPELNREEGTVAFTFVIDPGRRVYVRRININGNIKTRDEVIRREVRQMEGAWFDGTRIERSKIRIRRLGYFDDVNIETPPVPGSPDQIDVNITVVERNTGQVMVGIGYSSSERISLQASISQHNIFGSGNSATLGLNTSRSHQNFSLHFTDPYWTVDGISRTYELYKTRVDTEDLAVSYYKSDTLGAAIGFGVPVTETDTVNFGLRFENTKLNLNRDKSPQPFIDFADRFGYTTNSVMLSTGWSRDTRDDIMFPSRGRHQNIYTEVAVPPGDLSYWKAQYTHQWFWPIYDPFVLMLRGEVGYGGGYGGKTLPFFKAFYAGGVGSVRGYEGSSLGPQYTDKDGNKDALGGKRKIVGNAEVFFPLIPGDRSVRGSVFFDVGQIYQDGKQRNNESFRYSTGVGVAWNSPIGALKVSYGYPINNKPDDKIQRFQFQLGSVF